MKEAKEKERETLRNEQITRFSGGENGVFVKKKKEGFEGQLPKNTRAGLRCPQSQEECEEKRKTLKQKEGGLKRST